MIKNGFSPGLATLLIKKYQEYQLVNVETNTISLKIGLDSAMKRNDENSIYIFEARL